MARTAALAALGAAVGLGAGLLLMSGLVGDPGISDTLVYERYGERIVSGDVPYRDFVVEYPPGALIPFVLPALVSSTIDRYEPLFEVLMAAGLAAICALVVITLQAVRASTRRVVFAVGAFVLGVVLLGPFVLTRFDLYAAAFTLAAVCAILHRRLTLGPILLGLTIATKIYPAVLLPLLAARAWKRGGPRAAFRDTGLAVGAAVVVYLPFALVAPEGVARSVWRQLGRPLQIESLGSGVLLALHNAAGMPLAWASGSGSQNLTGTVASVAAGVTTILGLAALVLVWVRYARGETESQARFAQYAAAAVVAFVAFGKVVSPQFLVWLLAIVVIVPGLRGSVASALLVAACGLTKLWFPWTYWDLVKSFDPISSWLVLVRDLVLVILFVVLVVRLRAFKARERAPA
ncbi:MAG: glycosyltransferase 87 family protein [Thermoleophilia bacterium]|nr:glycosyltransferase 87 family protein [Thermoleophilia bacterium]